MSKNCCELWDKLLYIVLWMWEWAGCLFSRIIQYASGTVSFISITFLESIDLITLSGQFESNDFSEDVWLSKMINQISSFLDHQEIGMLSGKADCAFSLLTLVHRLFKWRLAESQSVVDLSSLTVHILSWFSEIWSILRFLWGENQRVAVKRLPRISRGWILL